MSEPPTKKRRLPNNTRTAVSSSEAPTTSSSRSALSSATTRATSKTASIALSTTSGSAKINGTAKTATSKKKLSTASPKKKSAQKSSPQKNKGLYAFFGGADRAKELEAAAEAKKKIQAQTVVISEDEAEEIDDLIEDSDEEYGATKLPVGRSVEDVVGGSNGSIGGISSDRFRRPPQAISSQLPKVLSRPKAIEDTRPWPIRYAPTNPSELAVNKTKVADVRKWLKGVFGRQLSQRILVLTGPAGSGKTATIEALGKEFNYDVLEWRNPSSATGAEYDPENEGAFSNGFAGLFEEFLGRAGRYGSLELAIDGKKIESTPLDDFDDSRQKVIVIEDFPNMLFSSSSAPLQSFRKALKSFLALPEPPPGAPALPPLILIITESATCSGPDAFTAWRLLSPEILGHPKVTEISFLKIAASFMQRALQATLVREAAETNRKHGPSKALLDALSQTGDIRSAMMTLEFLATRCDEDIFTERLLPTGKTARRKPASKELTARETQIIEAITNRESHFNIFHAVGKIVYNKRFGDDPDDPYMPPPPRPVLGYQRYHSRPIRPNLETLHDETGSDPGTFIAALHENFLYSCNSLSDNTLNSEDILDMSIDILESFSDADVLSTALSPHNNFMSYLSSSAASDSTTAALRTDALTFQLCSRQIMLSLPSPVKRDHRHVPSQTKLFYPTSARIWRKQEEVRESVNWYLGDSGLADLHHRTSTEALTERLPYLAIIERAKRYGWRMSKSGGWNGGNGWGARNGGNVNQASGEEAKVLEKVLNTVSRFRGEMGRSEEAESLEEEEEKSKIEGSRVVAWRRGKGREERELEEGIHGGVEGLVLSDDDIEEFD